MGASATGQVEVLRLLLKVGADKDLAARFPSSRTVSGG